MKEIYFASFYYRVWDLTREFCENKNPTKISTYTVCKSVFPYLHSQLIHAGRFLSLQKGKGYLIEV